jgi:hypothetical protein
MKKQKLILLGVLLIVFFADARQKKTKENGRVKPTPFFCFRIQEPISTNLCTP